MRPPDGPQAPRRDEDTASALPLGPPGWDEFSAARERFMRTMAVSSLEVAYAAPAREPAGRRADRRSP